MEPSLKASVGKPMREQTPGPWQREEQVEGEQGMDEESWEPQGNSPWANSEEGQSNKSFKAHLCFSPFGSAFWDCQSLSFPH